MNYISHYYLSICQKNFIIRDQSPYYIFGSVLPDLFSSYDRTQRIRIKDKISNDGQIVYHINKGILDHLKADEIFHNSNFFKNNVRYIKMELEKIKLKSSRRHLYFTSHILLELLLDRLLIKDDRGVCDDFYFYLNKIEEKYVNMYLNSQNFVKEPSGFFNFLKRFTKKSYLYNYVCNNDFIFALSKVIERTGNIGFDFKDYTKIEHAINNIETRLLKKDYKSIFYEIKEELA